MSRNARRANQTIVSLPRIGPCRDPLRLWFLEWADSQGQRWRRYYADRDEARRALKAFKVNAPAGAG